MLAMCKAHSRIVCPAMTTACLATALLLSGCAGLRGVQESVSDSDLKSITCPSQDEVQRFNSSDNADRVYAGSAKGMDQKSYRNAIIDTCMGAANEKFKEYASSLREESTSVKLGVSLATLTLAGLGAVGNGAQTAAAATQGLVGAGAAVSKELYFDQTLPALISAMNINRNEVLSKLQSNKAKSATDYSLGDAGADLWALQNASNMDLAIKQLTSVASQAEAATAGVSAPLFTVTAVSPSLQARRQKLAIYIQSLIGNRTQLKVIENALDMTDNPVNGDGRVAGDIRTEILARAQTDAQMDSLQALLAPHVPPEVFQ